jgi:hypothetical protein
MQKVFRMDKVHISGADHVALHDGVHVHIGGRARLFQVQSLPGGSWILGRNLLEAEQRRQQGDKDQSTGKNNVAYYGK